MKELPLPKLAQDQKYEDWLKQVDTWQIKIEKCWSGDTQGLGQHTVRLIKEMFKECKNEEIRNYAVKFIIYFKDEQSAGLCPQIGLFQTI